MLSTLLPGAAFTVAAILAATVYGFRMRQQARPWPYALAVGVALLGGGLLIERLVVSLIGVGVMGVDVFLAHQARSSTVRRKPRGH